jgi:hypothetical protein
LGGFERRPHHVSPRPAPEADVRNPSPKRLLAPAVKKVQHWAGSRTAALEKQKMDSSRSRARLAGIEP